MTDKPIPPDEVFLAAVRRMLDESLDGIDPWQAGRLQRARREALNVSARPPSGMRWAAGIAVASIGLLALVFVLNGISRDTQPTPFLEDLDLVTSSENVELSEDWEFYDWLSGAEASASPS